MERSHAAHVMHACLQGVGCILAAMTPCARLYGFIGLALAEAFPNARHAYSDWIATYSGRPYLSVPDAQEALLDEIGDQGNYGAPLVQHVTIRGYHGQADLQCKTSAGGG